MIAIIIPYYKIDYFEQTLHSLSLQTNKNFTVYIGDDASQNSCVPLLKQYEEKIDFIYHRFENNLGNTSLVNHWERCIALSNQEEWLMILGDDDVLAKNVIEEFYKTINKIQDCNVIRFASQVINKNFISDTFYHPMYENAVDFILRKIKNETRSSLSEYIFKRNVYNKYKFVDFPLAWYSDDRAWIEFSENKKIYTINNAIVSIRISNQSISGKKDNIALKNKAQELFLNYLLNVKNNYAKKDKLFLALEYEIAIKKNRKMENNDWKLLFKQYLRNFSFIPFLKFTRRYFIQHNNL